MWLNILKLQRKNTEGRARRILPFVKFYPAFLEVEANQNHINVRVFSEHSRPHWAWAVEVPRLGAPGAGVIYFRYPPHSYPHAFVSAPSFCIAAATGIGWDSPLVLNLTTGDLLFSPLLTPRFGGLFPSFGWSGAS